MGDAPRLEDKWTKARPAIVGHASWFTSSQQIACLQPEMLIDARRGEEIIGPHPYPSLKGRARVRARLGAVLPGQSQLVIAPAARFFAWGSLQPSPDLGDLHGQLGARDRAHLA